MSINSFKPTVWAGSLLRNLQNAHVYASPQVANRNYEGEIAEAGDTVKIHSIGRITVTAYTPNTDLSSPEALTDAETILTITQADSFNFQVDNVDARQAKNDGAIMDEASIEAAYALAETEDNWVGGVLVAGTDQTNVTSTVLGTTASPIAISMSGIGGVAGLYELCVDARTQLNLRNVPQQGRYVVLPTVAEAYALKDTRYTGYGTPGSQAQIASGAPIGRIAGFDVLLSNNVPVVTATKYKIVFGHPQALSFAEQINQVVAYSPEKRFADAMKGLHLYGAAVVRPKFAVTATATFA